MTWETLEQECSQCRKCSLGLTRTNLVFGAGAKDAKIMFVGEGPGRDEDIQGEPFVGRAGQLLDEMLGIIRLERNRDYYITNIVKCRPPENRDPLNEEQEACMPWIRKQYALVKPKIVVCLGRIAAARLIKPDFKITQEHGKWFEKNGTLFTAIYHPSALLRDLSKRPETFEDLMEIEHMIREKCPEVYER